MTDLFEPVAVLAPAADLPAPSRERFQPLRAGILNLWQYDEQEFRFHDGRLILRGENGTGKSKALEVLLPFLLDADLSAQRLDPFGGTSRSMEWNLLQDGRYESRTGYVWLELGRCEGRGESRTEHFWTLGCGLRATQRTRRVDPWYFLTQGRIGQDLFLVSPGRTPLLRDQLRQEIGQIGGAGWVFDTGRDYREKLDAQIFGLGEDRFGVLRHLLLQLRRPHLSEKLDPGTLSGLLKESLPPLDPDLISQLSEGFERLDNDQKELARAEAAAASVASFLDLYREYGRGAARGRAAEVRQSDSRYHKTASEVREAEADQARLDADLEALAGQEEQTRAAIGTARGTIQVLEQSPEMRSAVALRAKRETADNLARQADREKKDLEREGRSLEESRRDLAEAEKDAGQAAQERDGRALAALAVAREAGMEAVCSAASEALADRASAAEATVRTAVQQRQEGIAELRRLSRDLDQARSKEERAEERRREVDAQFRASVERRREADAEADLQRERLEEALLVWWQRLVEIRLDDDAFERLRSRIGDRIPLATAVHEAATPQRDALVRERTEAEREIGEIAALRRETVEERERVAAARELGPEPPRTRGADRSQREGAPLYLLCEFAESLGESERAGLEAALEAAGLLDAWLMPDGGVLSPETLDSFLIPDSGVGQFGRRTLADLLVPSPGHGVSREVIEAVLGSIEIVEEGSGGPAGVGTDGVFRLGPLQGAWAKATAEHVGAGAREAARQRRLAELAERIAGLDLQIAALEARREALDRRLERIARELEAVPSTAELDRARHQAESAAADESRRRTELEAATGEAAGARKAREAAEHRLEGSARDLGMAAYLKDLEGYGDRLRGFLGAFRDLAQAFEAVRKAQARSARDAERFREALSREEEARRRARESAAAAQSAQAEHAALEATAGVGARAVVERLQAEKAQLKDLEEQEESLRQQVLVARDSRAGARERVRLRQIDLEERDAERARSVGRLQKLVEIGFLSLVLEEAVEDFAATWSLTRALELAREIERVCAGIDLAQEAVNRRANRLHERYQILSADLGGDYQPALEPEGDLVVVRIGYNGRDHDIPGLLAELRESIEVRRALLADYERGLLQRFLLGEVGDHLRGRLLRAREHVDEMNELLVGCRTASGMTLKLAWEPLPEAAPEIREAVRLLRQDVALLSDGDRRRLETFFLERINEARQQWQAVPWREHLLEALDYRSWFGFRILRRTGEKSDWAELTRRGHDASSGGEKAVALHLPLFAAAAAHYRTAKPIAPRLILLDEAFAGIDLGMRGRCMGLLVAFDLDFMMTSHEEWGCYEELPGVATYQLFRDPAFEGVGAVRFVWDGRRLKEEREPE